MAFEASVGAASPLAADACACLGRILVKKGAKDDALPFLLRALEGEVAADAFRPGAACRLFAEFRDCAAGCGGAYYLAGLAKLCAPAAPLAKAAAARLGPASDAAAAAAMLKTAGEVAVRVATKYVFKMQVLCVQPQAATRR